VGNLPTYSAGPKAVKYHTGRDRTTDWHWADQHDHRALVLQCSCVLVTCLIKKVRIWAPWGRTGHRHSDYPASKAYITAAKRTLGDASADGKPAKPT
jgi:hypothetical protein